MFTCSIMCTKVTGAAISHPYLMRLHIGKVVVPFRQNCCCAKGGEHKKEIASVSELYSWPWGASQRKVHSPGRSFPYGAGGVKSRRGFFEPVLIDVRIWKDWKDSDHNIVGAIREYLYDGDKLEVKYPHHAPVYHLSPDCGCMILWWL